MSASRPRENLPAQKLRGASLGTRCNCHAWQLRHRVAERFLAASLDGGTARRRRK